ncbi:hypothetical protein BJ912DRAFT_1065183 [Pholiota molesta]|nr:hypothetical protein BJ912DRAFT_1065183 [Pholiota molesta]
MPSFIVVCIWLATPLLHRDLPYLEHTISVIATAYERSWRQWMAPTFKLHRPLSSFIHCPAHGALLHRPSSSSILHPSSVVHGSSILPRQPVPGREGGAQELVITLFVVTVLVNSIGLVMLAKQ